MLVKRNTLNDHLRILSKYGIKISQKCWASFTRQPLYIIGQKLLCFLDNIAKRVIIAIEKIKSPLDLIRKRGWTMKRIEYQLRRCIDVARIGCLFCEKG